MAELAALASDPLLLAIALFAATLVAEDAATIAAGVLVGSTGSDPYLALGAVILGTAVGDLALYGAGRWGAETALGTRLRRRDDVARALTVFARRMPLLLIVARFVPGMRLPVFTASGLASAPLGLVAAVVLLSTPVWTTILFEIARNAGAQAAGQLAGLAIWWALAMAVLLIVPRHLGRALLR
ncbi:MAG: VTT domain-containing protein [Sphingopyxis sp.]|nr:VTT domain-containing protein [Sphingopyxis sp.]